jgi:hypothetical protein
LCASLLREIRLGTFVKALKFPLHRHCIRHNFPGWFSYRVFREGSAVKAFQLTVFSRGFIKARSARRWSRRTPLTINEKEVSPMADADIAPPESSGKSGYRFLDLLTKTIEIGIEAASRDYAHDKQKREGAVRGFTECRGKSPSELSTLLADANTTTMEKRRDGAADYWYWRCRAAEIEWVANVISAVLVNKGMPPIVPPTMRGALFAAKLLEHTV